MPPVYFSQPKSKPAKLLGQSLVIPVCNEAVNDKELIRRFHAETLETVTGMLT